MADQHAYAYLRLNSYQAMCGGSLGRRQLHGRSEIISACAFHRFWSDPPFPIDGQPSEEGRNSHDFNASLSGWTEFLAGLDAAGKRMAQRLPERLRADPVAVQQSYRLMLAATARLAIDAIVGDRARSEEHTSE